MPLVTYFSNVGAALLVLLLIADFYLVAREQDSKRLSGSLFFGFETV
jgi:hypothetical protein